MTAVPSVPCGEIFLTTKEHEGAPSRERETDNACAAVTCALRSRRTTRTQAQSRPASRQTKIRPRASYRRARRDGHSLTDLNQHRFDEIGGEKPRARLAVGDQSHHHGAARARHEARTLGVLKGLPFGGGAQPPKRNGRSSRSGRRQLSFEGVAAPAPALAPLRPRLPRRRCATAAPDPPSRRAAARPLSVGYFHALGNGTAT